MQIEKIGPDTVTFQITMTHAERDLLTIMMMANVTIPETMQRMEYIDGIQEKALMELMSTIGNALTRL